MILMGKPVFRNIFETKTVLLLHSLFFFFRRRLCCLTRSSSIFGKPFSSIRSSSEAEKGNPLCERNQVPIGSHGGSQLRVAGPLIIGVFISLLLPSLKTSTKFSIACRADHYLLTESSMLSKTVLPIQDLACVLLQLAILCCLIKLYRALMYWEPRVRNHNQPAEVQRRTYRGTTNERNPHNHNRYPTEHDERRG